MISIYFLCIHINKINIRCCSKTIEKLFDIHFCDYATITIVSLCFIMLISKHDIIVKQSKFVRESLSRLSKKIVVKILTALKLYNNFFFQNVDFLMFKNEIMIYSMFSKFSIIINIENFKIFKKKIEKTFKLDTNAISNDMRYRIVIAMNSLKIFLNFVR